METWLCGEKPSRCTSALPHHLGWCHGTPCTCCGTQFGSGNATKYRNCRFWLGSSQKSARNQHIFVKKSHARYGSRQMIITYKTINKEQSTHIFVLKYECELPMSESRLSDTTKNGTVNSPSCRLKNWIRRNDFIFTSRAQSASTSSYKIEFWSHYAI